MKTIVVKLLNYFQVTSTGQWKEIWWPDF